MNVECSFCEFRCSLKEGSTGVCGCYFNNNGFLTHRFSGVYSIVTTMSLGSIPILHYKSKSGGGKLLAVGGVGCNFRCRGCISRVLVELSSSLKTPLYRMEPVEVARKAVENGCCGAVYCFSEPAVHYQDVYELAIECGRRGLVFGLATNLYYTKTALEKLIDHIDFVNVGVKGWFREYSFLCGIKNPEPVFRNIKLLVEKGVHVEASILYARGFEDDVMKAALEIAGASDSIPIHIMRFIDPTGESRTLEPSVADALRLYKIVSRTSRYTYLFNTPAPGVLGREEDSGGERVYGGPMSACSRGSRERGGGWSGYGVAGFMQMIYEVCVKNGFSVKEAVEKAYEAYRRGLMRKLYRALNETLDLNEAFKLIREVGCEVGVDLGYEKYLRALEHARRVAGEYEVKPRVYVCMSHPLYARRYPSLQCLYVEECGCTCINKMLTGNPVNQEELSRLSPDVIVIEPFFKATRSFFIEEARKLGVKAPAIDRGFVFKVPREYGFLSRMYLMLEYIAGVIEYCKRSLS